LGLPKFTQGYRGWLEMGENEVSRWVKIRTPAAR
jgi:hypothetical protein